jgi:hypothetical protein
VWFPEPSQAVEITLIQLLEILASLWNHPVSRAGTDVPEGGNRVSATVTGYTPTTFEDFFDNLYRLKPHLSPEEYEFQRKNGGPNALMNPENDFFNTVESLTSTWHVNEQTPPAFLWQTTADSPGFAWEYAAALKKYGTEYELHYFSDGSRCVSLRFDPEFTDSLLAAEKNTMLWPEMSLNFLARVLNL